MRINSPGGSPVQAGYVNDEIKRLRKNHPEIPIFAVITDICTSGGYYIAAAADKIFANKASIVGSIGVVMSGFGFVDAIEKLGLVKSRSETKRLIKSNGIKIDDKNYKENDFSLSKHISNNQIKISIGKKKIGILKIIK